VIRSPGEERSLASSEIHRLAELDEQADLRGQDEVDAHEALYDLDSSQGRAAYIGEQLQVPEERPEPSANVIGEDGEFKPGYDLDSSKERVAAIDALMAGEDVATYDNSYEAIEGD
jgi:hypothetical protein